MAAEWRKTDEGRPIGNSSCNRHSCNKLGEEGWLIGFLDVMLQSFSIAISIAPVMIELNMPLFAIYTEC